jgi:hypothetical protein
MTRSGEPQLLPRREAYAEFDESSVEERMPRIDPGPRQQGRKHFQVGCAIAAPKGSNV